MGVIDKTEAVRFLQEFAQRPDLWDKDSELTPTECLVLAAFNCNEWGPHPEWILLREGGTKQALLRLQRMGTTHPDGTGNGERSYVYEVTPVRGGHVYRMSHGGHEAEHRFLETNWHKLRDYDADLRCGACGTGHTIRLRGAS